jgi:hypothetical protein
MSRTVIQIKQHETMTNNKQGTRTETDTTKKKKRLTVT